MVGLLKTLHWSPPVPVRVARPFDLGRPWSLEFDSANNPGIQKLLPPKVAGGDPRQGPGRSGVCLCAGSSGEGCEKDKDPANDVCPGLCSGHGFCRRDGCSCEAGFGGNDCGVACAGRCSGHGRCDDDGSCICERGYYGDKCQTKSDCPGACSGRGICRATDGQPAKCFCAPGWTGSDDCSVRDLLCPLGCSGHGRCNNGTCECNHGWHGELCATSTVDARTAALQQQHAWRVQLASRPCPHNCSGRGACLHGSCYCERGYEGLACNKLAAAEEGCAEGCGAHGECVAGRCMCDSGWWGSTCAEEGVSPEEPQLATFPVGARLARAKRRR